MTASGVADFKIATSKMTASGVDTFMMAASRIAVYRMAAD